MRYFSLGKYLKTSSVQDGHNLTGSLFRSDGGHRRGILVDELSPFINSILLR